MARWLESLTISGFKSFAQEQTLSFERGLCVISGPNGVGKSNVIDALLFALGEEHAKLRVARLGDLRTSSVELAAGSLACAVTAVIRVLADGACGRHVLSAELKADRCERKLDGSPITTKALREWLHRTGLIAEGALYCIRQAAVQDAVQSATLYPLIVQASGCSSYLAARADATVRLRADESRLAKITADMTLLQTVVDRAQREHAAVVEREHAVREHAQFELVLGLVQDEMRAAEQRERSEQARAFTSMAEQARQELAACDASRVALAERLATLEANDAEAQHAAEEMREQFERLLPQIESEEQTLVEARIEMASAATRLARIKMSVAEATDAADGTLVKLKALHERRALLSSTEDALTRRWSKLLASPGEIDVSAELQRERERLHALGLELAAKRDRAGTQLAKARESASKARAALLDARQAVVTLETSLAETCPARAAEADGELGLPRQLEEAECQRSRLGLQLGRLEQEMQRLARDIGERTRVPAIAQQLLSTNQRPVHTLASLVEVSVEAEQWSCALDTLLGSALKCLVVETTADASTLVQGAHGASSEPLRVWPLDRIQQTDVEALRRAQDAVIAKLGAEGSVGVARPLALLTCANGPEEQAIAFAVGTKLLVKDGETAHRVFAAASSNGLAWCVDECIATDGTRHRRGTVRGGFDRRANSQQLVGLLARQAVARREAHELAQTVKAQDEVVTHLRTQAHAHALHETTKNNLEAARACLAAATECARLREEHAEDAASGGDNFALALEIVDAARRAWPAPPLQYAHDMDASSARDAVARCTELLRAQCRARYTAIDDQLALAENLDIKAHANAESCAQLCERLEWTANACAKRAEAAALRLAQLDSSELATTAAECEVACLRAGGGARALADARAVVRANDAARAQHAETLASYEAKIQTCRDAIAQLQPSRPRAAREAAWTQLLHDVHHGDDDGDDCDDEDRGGGDLIVAHARSAELTSLLKRCSALLSPQSNGFGHALQPDETEDDEEDTGASLDAWRALASEVRATHTKVLSALRRLEASTASLDKTRVLAEAKEQRQRRAELAGFESKRKTIIESMQVLTDGIAETDEKSRAAIDTSLEAISRAFGATFSELVPSKEATILTTDGRVNAADDATRQLSVAVRAKSASRDSNDGAWSADLRELSGGQRTLLSIALLVSCSLHKAGDLLVIDEVDAALDDKNVELIAHLLQRVARKTQVIAISHRSEFQRCATSRIAISTGSRVVASTVLRK